VQKYRETRVWNYICLLLFCMVGAVRALRPEMQNYSDNTLIYILLIVALGIWTDRMRKRISAAPVRRYITAVSLLILFLMILRTFKFVFLPEGHLLARFCWYGYYVPLNFIPLFLFLAVLYVGRPYGYIINRRWLLLYIPATLLALLFLTNDFHGLAFSFPRGMNFWDSEPYRYGPVYLAEGIWIAFFSVAILLVTVTRCAIAEYRKKIWMPLLPLVAGVFYTGCYLLKPDSYFLRLYKFAEIVSFIFPAFLEGMILAHLFPSNDSYENLWKVSDLKFGIMGQNGKIVFQSDKGLPVTYDEVVLAEKQEIFSENDNLVLRSHAVSGGYSFWFKDITEMNQINRELMEMGDVLAEENAILQAENSLNEKKSRLAEQARLYNEISRDVEKQLQVLSVFLAKPPEEEREFIRAMKEAAIFQVYVKRRSNLLLLASEHKFLSAMELWISIRESLSYVELSGRRTFEEYTGDGSLEMEAEKVLLLYHMFEDVLEEAMPAVKAVMLTMGIEEEAFTLRMELAEPEKLFSGDCVQQQLTDFGAEYHVEIDRNNRDKLQTAYVYLRMPRGGIGQHGV